MSGRKYRGSLTEEQRKEVERMRKSGVSCLKIAKVLETSETVIERYCKKVGLDGYLTERHNFVDRFVKEFNEEYGEKFEYISGYKNRNSHVLIRCKVCNNEFTRGVQAFRKRANVTCVNCKKIETKNKALEERERIKLEKAAAKKKAKEERLLEKERERELLLNRTCPECGEHFKADHLSRKYCSRRCIKRAHKQAKKLRELKRESVVFDGDISLGKLIEKHNNTCYICGKQCDEQDYEITKEGYFIVGGNYPSVEHIVPISKGGTHSWDNVNLAHCHCNSIKSNRVVIEKTGQFSLTI